jgi:gamma-glutamyltranspeptidase
MRSAATDLLVVLVTLSLTVGCGAPEHPGGASETQESERVIPAENRPDVAGLNGAVVACHPLAAAAGHAVLLRGGNAVDAAVTMAGVLAVVRPHMNGVGGDAFALILDAATGRVHALNGSGRAGRLATPEHFAEQGLERVPGTGPLTVTVPGAVSAWAAALERFGTLTLAEALAPAMALAREGWVVTRTLHRDAASSSGRLNDAGQAIFRPGGEFPPVGGVLRNPALARTLEILAREGAEGFYRGSVARALVSFLQEEGGLLTLDDFQEHRPEWTEPLALAWNDLTLLAFPPNSQGFAQLQQIGMAREFSLAEWGHNTADYLHTLVELKKLAFADRGRWLADPAWSELPVDQLLDPAYLASRAALVGPAAAMEVKPGVDEPMAGGGSGTGRPASEVASGGGETALGPDAWAREGTRPATSGTDGTAAGVSAGDSSLDSAVLTEDPGLAPSAPTVEPAKGDGDTVYLMAVDSQGNAVSWIQSLFSSWGSGLVEPETGIVLQNRGSGFVLTDGHPNRIAPGKRPFHTLNPVMVLDAAGHLRMTLGTPGGDGQTQFLTQVFHNLMLFGMSPQAAAEAPRFRSEADGSLLLEDGISRSVREALQARGHDVRVSGGWTATFGGVQVILRDPLSGALRTGADPRREAYAIAY